MKTHPLAFLVRTDPDDYVAGFLRVVLGTVLLPHGLQKLLGVFGGAGLQGTLAYFASLGIPKALGYTAIATETLGALFLFLGLMTRFAAFGALAVFVVAAVTVHFPNGFFMNWSGQQKGEGVEFFILGVAVAIAVLAKGGGARSVDSALVKPKEIDYSMMGR
jgi:putative oxidoreductase